MTDKIKRGDMILIRRGFFWTDVVIVNRVLKDDSLFVDDRLWSDGSDAMIRWCERITKDKIITIL